MSQIAPPPPPAGHFRLACSAAHETVHCPGSVIMKEAYAHLNVETESSREGTAAHWVWETLREGGMVYEYAPNGVAVTDEMLDGADLLNSDIDRTLRDHPDAVVHVEETMRISLHPQNGGTPDAWAWVPRLLTLYVWDYKFGFEFVDARENFQGINYIAGILEQLGINGLQDQQVTVVFRIVQPRYYHSAGPVREWKVKASDLRPYFNQLIAAYEEATGDDPHIASGGHCVHCVARHACAAYKNTTRRVLDYVDSAIPEPLDDDALGIELRIMEDGLQRVKSRYEALKADAEARFAEGRRVGGWGTEPVYGRKKWNVPAEEVAMLGDMFGTDLRKPLDVITPTQAMNKKNIDESVISAYIETPRKGLALVKLENSLAMRAFKKVD